MELKKGCLMELKKGEYLICCSNLCENFILGNEYKITDISYSGNSYEFIDENGDFAGIGSAYFTTKEQYLKLTDIDIKNNDEIIKESYKELDNFREQQWQDFLLEN
jgi:hypothetical protein